MTREELKEHCEKQVENCEMWARCIGEEPHGKIYEEHKLILELLEQEPFKPMVEIDLYSVIKQKYIEREVLDKIRAEIDRQQKWLLQAGYSACNVDIALDAIKAVVAESEVKE